MHCFAESLAMSHRASDWSGWEPLYRQFFPSMIGMHDHRKDGDHQRAGIDRSIVLEHAKVIWVDEKVRGRNKKTGKVYDDILLEVFSDKARRAPGWVLKPLQCDYIAYLIAPLGICHLLPVLQLQLAWQRHGTRWTQTNGTREAKNAGWTTVSVPVSPAELYPAIGSGLRGKFDAWEYGESGLDHTHDSTAQKGADMKHEPVSQADGYAESLTGRIYDLIAVGIDVMPLEIQPGCVLRDDLGADDGDIDRLRRLIDRTFGVYVPAPDAQQWRQVADVVAYVTKRVQG